MALSDKLTGLLGGAGQLATAYLPYEASQGIIDYLQQQGTSLGQQARTIGQEAAQAAEFQPFAVTTGTGTTQVGPGGAVTQQLAQTPEAIQQGLLSQALGQVGAATPTAQDLFSQMQSIRQPSIEREQQALENRLFAQGRGGVQTAAYGGTPEQLAMQKAIQEQQSADLLTAMQQAPGLAGQNIQNIQGLLGAAYAPESALTAALQPAVNLSNIAQGAQQGMSEALYKGGIAGLETQAAADTAVAGLEQARVASLADALSGLFAGGTRYNPSTGTFETEKSTWEQVAKYL
jgi:hypothetical protein